MTHPKTDDVPLAIQLMESDPELYEQYLLAALDKDEDLWSNISRLLCWDHMRGFFVNEFNSPLHYAIYMAMRGWRQLQSECGMATFSPMTEVGMFLQLQFLSQQPNPIIDEENIDNAKQIFLAIRETITREEAINMVSSTWRSWLNKKKVMAKLTDIRRSGGVDLDKQLDELMRTKELVQSTGQTDDTCAEFGDGIDVGEQFVERIPLGTSFTQLNGCLGGGLGKTEHIMFVAATGAGKTVLACQLAAAVASTNKQVLLISTEQHSRELEPRIISALGTTGNILLPFNLIKDGGDYKKILSENQYNSYLAVRKSLRGKLHFENWLGSGLSVTDNLENIVKKRIQQYGHLDALILDWIGGALVAGISDPGVKRQMYLDAAYTMKVIAERYNIACVSMAQATADAVGVSRVTEKYIAESKTMHREAVAGFGISAIRINETEEEAAAYSDDQNVFCFKSRKAVGRFFKIKRNFSFQRFENM